GQYEQDYQRAILEQPPIVCADMERRQNYAPVNNLTKEIVDEFVKAIYIETDGSISVIWSFSDPFLTIFCQIEDEKSFVPIVTDEYVSRIEKKAVEKLKEALDETNK
ncbi:MAG: hypothetical protein RR332_02815, partial [Clostridiales bacterium]